MINFALLALLASPHSVTDKTLFVVRNDASESVRRMIEDFKANPSEKALDDLEKHGWIVQTHEGWNYVIDTAAVGLHQLQFQLEVYELLMKSPSPSLISSSSAGPLGDVVRTELRNGFMLGSAVDDFDFHMSVRPASEIVVSDGDQRQTVMALHGEEGGFPPSEYLRAESGQNVEKYELPEYVRPYGKEFLEIFVKTRDPLEQAIARRKASKIVEDMLAAMYEKVSLAKSKTSALWSSTLDGIDGRLIDSPLLFAELKPEEQGALSSIFTLNSKDILPTTKIVDIRRYIAVRVNVKSADGKGLPKEFILPLE